MDSSQSGSVDSQFQDDLWTQQDSMYPSRAAVLIKWTVQVVVVVLVVTLVVVPVVVLTRIYSARVHTPADRVRCLDVQVDREECEGVGCVWDPQGDAPNCFFPPASSHGYEVTTPEETTSAGVKSLRLTLKNTSAPVVKDMKEELLVEMMEYGQDMFRIKVTVPGEERYEVPVSLDLPPVTSSNTPKYNVTFSDSGSSDFTIVVTRTDTRTVIFDTSIGGLTYANQFLQVSTHLASSYLYGLGEGVHTTLKHDLRYVTWPMFARDQSPLGPGENLYGSHPMYLVVEDDGNAHAVLWLNSNAMEAETMPLPGLTLRSIGGVIDLYFFMGSSPTEALQQYTQVVGRPVLPPYWALGFHLCRYGYGSLDNLKAAVSRTRRQGIPQDVQYADIDYMDRRMDFTYDNVSYAGLPEYIREVKDKGLRFIINLDPAINAEMSEEEYPVHHRALQKDVYIKWPQELVPEENHGGGDIMLGYVWPDNRTAFPDFLRSSTKEWWKEEIIRLYDTLEFDGLWLDMNEPANFGTNENKPWNWPHDRPHWSLTCPTSTWDDPPYPVAAITAWGQGKRLSERTLCMVGLQGEERQLRHYDVHNLYGWSQTLPTLEALQEVTGKRGIVVSRSTFPSSGRWAGHWLGDNLARWPDLHTSIIGMIEFNMFGIPYVGADICGFFADTTEELCQRWMQLGAFYPYSRNHNTEGTNEHDPGLWPSVASSSRAALQVRYTLLPYLYTLHYLAHTQGLTVVRALFFEFPDDKATLDVDDQFLWGSWLMIAPVLKAREINRGVYFPAGAWYDYYTGEAVNQLVDEGVTLVVEAPRTHVPVYVRGGGVLLTQRPRSNTKLARSEPLGLVVAPDREGNATGTLYWDDGEELNPIGSGRYFTADVTYSNEIITWQVTRGSEVAEGLLLSEVRVFRVEGRPTQLLVDGQRWTTGDWHYHRDTQVLQMFDLALPATHNFTLTWTEQMDFKIPCPISYKDWSEDEPVTEVMCKERNCVWEQSNKIQCSIPPLVDYGFEFVDGKVEETQKGFKTLLRKAGSSFYGGELERLTFEVFLYSDDTLRVKFYQEGAARHEVPVELNLPTTGAKNPLYEVVLPHNPKAGDPFFFYVVRKGTGTILFNTKIGGLTFSNQFLSITSLLPSKNVYGLGENAHDNFRHDLSTGRLWPIFSRDEGPAPGEGEEMNLYGAHPYYQCVENDGLAHGVLLLNSNAMDYQLLDYPSITFRTLGGVLDLYLMLGPGPEAVVSQYTALIHRPIMPPYWALGFQLCRYGYASLQELQGAVNRTRDAGIPQDVQYGDVDYMDRRMDFTIDQDNYQGFPEYVEQMKEDGLRFIVILDPTINAELPKEEYPTHHRALEADVYIKWAAATDRSVVQENNGGDLGNVMLGYVWPDNKTAFPNFFKESTKDWWVQEITFFYNTLKFDGLWIDMNEPANFGTNENKPWNWPHDRPHWSLTCPTSTWDDPPYLPKAGSHGPSRRLSDKTLCLAAWEEPYLHYDVHNLYGWAQTEATLRAAQRLTGKRSLVVTRSTYPGSGQWAGHWLGDNRSQWPDMAHSIIGMLEFNLFGIPYVGADICGFFLNTTEELCQRWMELGAFYPYSRNHNQKDAVDQDPGLWPNTVAKSSKKALEIRYRLLPYLYTLFYYAYTQGHTVVRPLLHEFSGDRRTLGIDDQFLWGPAFMVSPVLTEGAIERDVYFPNDAWYDYYTGQPVEWPGEYVKVSAPRDQIPLHVRGGHILPTQRPALNTQLARQEPMGLLVAIGLDRRASGHLFWDDGEAINTVTNKKYSFVEFTFVQDILKVTVLKNLNEDLGELKMVDLEFLGVEKEPSQILLNQQDLFSGNYSYEKDSLRLLVSLDVDLNKDFELELKDIWYYVVDMS
ncbi:probable maltase-glucoamylase 2 isoform X2 [Homarus americanus]|uniref:probable maltase-glucoamylase 2 isoform X2 n=1 Tax=Homarus americanus TaxID=6706 RepID=UPI001C454BCE|nr:probable maltase-glucoamylase 2 isoform X2 [Homarus americanus]